jgi:phage-related protein
MALSMSFFSSFFLFDCREQLQNNISGEKLTGCDGEMFTGMATDVRHIEITGFFDAVIGRRAMEGELKKVFNTGCTGTLEYFHKTDRKRYTINCYMEKTPEVIFNNARVEFVINLKCLDPYWYGEEITRSISSSLTFVNIGDSVAGAVYELTGSASDPYISNGASKVAFIGGLSGRTLKITSLPDKSLVEVGGANAMRYLTDPSRRDFFLLDIGTNTVSYGAASGAGGLSARLIYKPRYLGAF